VGVREFWRDFEAKENIAELSFEQLADSWIFRSGNKRVIKQSIHLGEQHARRAGKRRLHFIQSANRNERT
jgi:hypothetical protein